MQNRYLGIILLAIIFIALFAYFFLGWIPREEIYDPFSEKTRLIRYYACSLAICTKGCNWLNNHNMCLEMDSSSKECKSWCNDVCDNMPGSCNAAGNCCGSDYSLDISLKSSSHLRGCSKFTGGHQTCFWDSDISKTLEVLNKNENFPKLDEITCTDDIWHGGEIYIDSDGGIDSAFIGKGSMLLTSSEAYNDFSCKKVVPSGTPYPCVVGTNLPYHSFTAGCRECGFNGNLKISSIYENNGCADISLRVIETPQQGDFVLWPVPDSKTIPIKQQDSFEIKITNNLGSDQPFTISIESTNGIYCGFEGENTIPVANGNTEFVTMKCNPTQFPPSGQDSYTVVVKAIGGGITHITKVDVIVSDFAINITPDERKIASVGDHLIYTVGVDNRLGKDADFTLSSIYDPSAGCTLTLNLLHVGNGKFNTTTMNCTPGFGSHEVMVIASYETIEHNATIEIDVPVCSVNVLNLKFIRSDYEITNVNSGDDFDIRVSGFTGCQGFNINLYVSPGLYIGNCIVDPSGSTCRIGKTAGTPGAYEFNATMLVNGFIHNDSNDLTINKPTIPDRGSPQEGCLYWFPCWCGHNWGFFNANSGGICHECHCYNGGATCGDEPCKLCTDPQTCADQSLKTQASASNVCCLYNLETYSPGPKNGPPCLSPDTNSHDERTENFWYGGKDTDIWGHDYWGVEYARNVLVQDHKYATFKYDECEGNEDCTGNYGDSTPPSSLSSVVCQSGRCKLSDSLPTYTSWLYIKISESSRPVYGVIIEGYNVGGCGEWHVLLHNSSGWFDTKATTDRYLNAPYDTERFIPVGKWSWDKIDAMLLVKADNCYPKFESYIDYIGLLTKDYWTTYCTDGTGDYNRIVDDGKTCYWGMDCPTANSKGWVWDGSSSKIGPLTDVGCDCSSGSCGNGYCEFSDMNGNRLCYYKVMCMTGGWNGNIDKCNSGETCGYNGCV